MAMKGHFLGIPIVVKQSGGKFYPSRGPSWMNNPSAVPAAVKRQNEKLAGAAKACKGKSNRRSSVFSRNSAFLDCVRAKL